MESKITLRHMEAFRAVMLRRSVTAAAQSLGVTQPVVTRLIVEFEKRIGIVLFERIRGRLQPTADAVLLLEDVHQSLVGVERIANAAENVRVRQLLHIEIAAAPAMTASFLPAAIAKFSADHPETLVSLYMHSSPTVLHMVQNAQCDMGFVMLSPDHTPHKGLEPLVVGKMVVAVPTEHRLANRSSVGPADFIDERQIAPPGVVEARVKLDEVFLAHRVQQRINVETQISYAAIKLVEVGAGVAIIDPLTACAYQQESGVRFIPFVPNVACEYLIVVSARHASTLVLKPFIDLAREEIRRLLPKAWTLKDPHQRKPLTATAR